MFLPLWHATLHFTSAVTHAQRRVIHYVCSSLHLQCTGTFFLWPQQHGELLFCLEEGPRNLVQLYSGEHKLGGRIISVQNSMLGLNVDSMYSLWSENLVKIPSNFSKFLLFSVVP